MMQPALFAAIEDAREHIYSRGWTGSIAIRTIDDTREYITRAPLEFTATRKDRARAFSMRADNANGARRDRIAQYRLDRSRVRDRLLDRAVGRRVMATSPRRSVC